MALNRAQLMNPPGGPGVIGAVKAGLNIQIEPDGTINAIQPTLGLGDVLPGGTKMVFTQATAPTGWTIDTTNVGATLRMNNIGGGTGGSLDFTNVFANQVVTGTVSLGNLSVSGTVGSTSLNVNQIASHTHTYLTRNQCCTENVPVESGQMARQNTNTGAAGGNQGHNHSWTGTVVGSGTFTGGNVDLRVKYIDCIVATKN